MPADVSPAFTAPVSNSPDGVAKLKRLLGRPVVTRMIWESVSQEVADVERGLLKSPALLRLPRRAEERQNGFEKWLAEYRGTLTESLSRELARRLNGVAPALGEPQQFGDTLSTTVWPQVEPQICARSEQFLLHFAVRGLALNQLSRHIGEGLVVGDADHLGKFWRVSLLDRRGSDPVASLALDEDGNVLTDVSALHATLPVGRPVAARTGD